MPRYIDAEELNDEYYELFHHGTMAVKSVLSVFVGLLEKQPTADVVEVVRCKDCVHWECVCGGTTGRCESPRNGLLYEYTDNFDYCSYGERKDEITM